MNRAQKLASLVSNVFHPVLLAVAALAVIVSRFVDSTYEYWEWLLISTALLLTGPVLFVAIRMVCGQYDDIALRDRHHRIVPLILASLGALVGSFLVVSRDLDRSLILMSYVLVADLLALTIITIFWKISIHAATLTALITLLVVFRGLLFVPAFLLVPLVCWARYTLRRHTLAQLIAGSLVGIGLTSLTALIFR